PAHAPPPPPSRPAWALDAMKAAGNTEIETVEGMRKRRLNMIGQLLAVVGRAGQSGSFIQHNEARASFHPRDLVTGCRCARFSAAGPARFAAARVRFRRRGRGRTPGRAQGRQGPRLTVTARPTLRSRLQGWALASTRPT